MPLHHGSPNLSGKAYGDIFVSSTAELPGLVLAALFVDRLGRRRTMGGSLLLNFVCTLPLLAYAVMPTWLETLSLFAARCSMMSAFTARDVHPPHHSCTVKPPSKFKQLKINLSAANVWPRTQLPRRCAHTSSHSL